MGLALRSLPPTVVGNSVLEGSCSRRQPQDSPSSHLNAVCAACLTMGVASKQRAFQIEQNFRKNSGPEKKRSQKVVTSKERKNGMVDSLVNVSECFFDLFLKLHLLLEHVPEKKRP